MGKHPLIVALATSLVGLPARAAPPAQSAIDLTFQDCESDPIGEPSFRQALRLELDQELAQRATRAGSSSAALSPQIEVRFRCDGVALIRIQLQSGSSQRRVRFDDVAKSERARALALVVAEQYRSQGSIQQFPVESPPEDHAGGENAEGAPSATRPPVAPEPAKAPAPAAPPRRPPSPPSTSAPVPPDAGVEPQSQPATASRPRVRGTATLRAALGEVGTHYGGGLGLDLTVVRLSVEALFARETRTRGAISSGVVALRVARGVPFVRAGSFELSGVLSAAVGATWAVGQSDVVGSVVRDVLMPYGDARLGLVSALHVDGELAPELGLYAGRAAGILARADGEATQATGGWFAGVEAGISF
ncbi:MAG TPA: hypothetical protein VG937_19985 [Polyangiaceae bacterium]|nr:hypothetical protein [Polyangiaceae bacterium]